MGNKYIPCDQIAKLNVSVKNLVCAITELSEAVKYPGSDSGSGSSLNEAIVKFGVSSYDLVWDDTWKAKFGPAAVFDTYIQDQLTGKWLRNPVQAVADNPATPSMYSFNFGSPVNIVIVVS